MKIKDEQLNDQQIEDIYALYKIGIPKLHIARRFNKHHSTIIYHIIKKEKSDGTFIAKKKILKRSSKETYGEDFIRVKCYADYLQEEKDRNLKKKETCSHTRIIKTFRCHDCGNTHIEDIYT